MKPEHKQHRKVGILTDRQYRLWVGMITEADDEGRLVADATWLRAICFAYQPSVTTEMVTDELKALDEVGLIRLYRVQNTLYAAFPSWTDHQRIDRPRPSLLPRPSVHERSSKPRRKLDESSSNDRRGSEGSGSEGSGSGSEGREGIIRAADAAPPEVRQVFDAYFELFKTRYGEKPAINGGKDGANVKRLIARYGLPKVIDMIGWFFESADPFVITTGHSLGAFTSSAVINKLIAQSRAPMFTPKTVGNAAAAQAFVARGKP